MAANKGGWMVCGLLGVAGAVVLALRWQATEQLRTEIRLTRDDVAMLARLRQTREELARSAVPASELEDLRADRAAVQRLRAEMEALKAKTEKAVRRPPAAPPAPAKDPDTLAAKVWANVGRATPRAALQTSLWAALNGDVNTLADSIVFETAAAREQAERLLAEAPPSLRAEYSTPEKLVALLSAKDMPTDGMMRVVGEKVWNDSETSLGVLFFPEASVRDAPPPKPKDVMLKLRRESSGEWKLALPAIAVDKYGAMLRGQIPANAK